MHEIIFLKVIPNGDIILSCIYSVAGLIIFTVSFYGYRSNSRINARKEVLIVLTKTHIEVPGQKIKRWFNKPTPDITLQWDGITKIHLENYKTGGRSKTHHNKIYFYTSEGKAAEINSQYLGVPMLEFFTSVRKFYTGPIIREYKQGCYQELIKDKDHDGYTWDEASQS